MPIPRPKEARKYTMMVLAGLDVKKAIVWSRILSCMSMAGDQNGENWMVFFKFPTIRDMQNPSLVHSYANKSNDQNSATSTCVCHHLTSPGPSPILMTPFFLLSASHLSIQLFIFARPGALPTLTVGMIFSMFSAQQNIVNSRKLLCSEYGTPKQLASFVLPLCGTSSLI